MESLSLNPNCRIFKKENIYTLLTDFNAYQYRTKDLEPILDLLLSRESVFQGIRSQRELHIISELKYIGVLVRTGDICHKVEINYKQSEKLHWVEIAFPKETLILSANSKSDLDHQYQRYLCYLDKKSNLYKDWEQLLPACDKRHVGHAPISKTVIDCIASNQASGAIHIVTHSEVVRSFNDFESIHEQNHNDSSDHFSVSTDLIKVESAEIKERDNGYRVGPASERSFVPNLDISFWNPIKSFKFNEAYGNYVAEAFSCQILPGATSVIHSVGKGKEKDQVMASCLGEFYERLSMLTATGESDLLLSSEVAASKANFIPLKHLRSFSDYQMNNAQSLNKTQLYQSFKIPKSLPVKEQINWAKAYSLIDEQLKYVPRAFITKSLRERDHLYINPDSTGHAVGATYQEAFLEGLFEVVERDAAAIWWQNKIKLPHVEHDSVPDGYVSRKIKELTDQGMDTCIIDISTDNEIPCFCIYISKGGADLSFGFGCHLDPILALERALTECIQSLHFLQRRGKMVKNHISQWSFLIPDSSTQFKASKLN
ncbi:MAG: YcaO-like family protein, partial [Bacteriovoracaceae bacterium]|nr:YcaO-like family protein [Bacteriovoracaceae bacterium]